MKRGNEPITDLDRDDVTGQIPLIHERFGIAA